GVDGVVHCAALLPGALGHVPDIAFEEVNVGGTRNVLMQAARLLVRRAVFFSTISVVDHVGQKITRENLRAYITNPHDAYLKSKIDAEKELVRLQPEFPGRLSIIRPAFIYGPGNYAVWSEALELIVSGKMTLIGDGSARLPLIYAEDIAHYVEALLRQPFYPPSWDIHVLAHPEPTTMRDVFDFLAGLLGAPRPKRVPYWAVRLASLTTSLLPAPLRVGRL